MRTLLIDTCGDVSRVALADGGEIVRSVEIPARSASVSLLSSIDLLLQKVNWSLQQLDGVAVVSGPGSFTGMRVGLACAKGLCEALRVPITGISRLQVLASAASQTEGFAVLNAGRGEIYVLDLADGTESLRSIDRFKEEVQSSRIVVAEHTLIPAFGATHIEHHSIHLSAVLPLALERLEQGGDDLATLDANYVRSERQIYGKAQETKASD